MPKANASTQQDLWSFTSRQIPQGGPSQASGVYLSSDLSKKFPDFDFIFYLDLWPFSSPLMIVSSPSTFMQAVQQHDLQKPQAFEDLLAPVLGRSRLLTMNGDEWKLWRDIFNQGSSTAYLLENISDIVEEVSIFYDILRHHARTGDLLQMETITVWLTLDIIGNVSRNDLLNATILDIVFAHFGQRNTRLNSQRGQDPLASALRSQIHWLSYRDEINPWQRWHPLRSIIQWYNGRQMNKFIIKELDNRFKERKKEPQV